MTDLRAQIEALLRTPNASTDAAIYNSTMRAVLDLIPEGSFLVTRTTPRDVERIMRTMRYHPDLRGQRHQFREGWDAAVLALPDVLTPEPTDD
jgi:hypothetical protein